MPKKKGRKGGRLVQNHSQTRPVGGRGRGNGRGEQPGRGRGGFPGIIRAQNAKQGKQLAKENKRRETKERRRQFGVAGIGAGGNNGAPLGRPVEEVRDDGFLRHQEIPKAHTDAVMAIVMDEGAIYTGSRDKHLKRWKVGRNPATNRFELTVDLEVNLGDICWSMIMAGEWIFCGLGDGTIKGYSKSGAQAVLKAHTKRINVLKLHQHVLISGSSDGTVRMWQADASGVNFVCTNTITEGISSAVICLAVLAEHLWVGGSSGVSVVELASLRVVSQIQPKKFVAGFQEFQGHMIVAYADGELCIFDVGGVKKLDQPPMDVGPILAVAGLECGPRFLCGHAKGQISSFELPSFRLRQSWQAFERAKVQSLCCAAGPDGIFMLGAENGNLQIWQRDGSVP